MAKATHPDDYTATPPVFYLGGLDDYVRGYMKRHGEYFTAQGIALDQPAGMPLLNEALLDVAEALMLGDGVVLRISGENTVLPYLVRMFGGHETAEMIRRRWIEFVGEGQSPGAPQEGSVAQYPDGTPVPPGQPVYATFQWANAEPDVFHDGRIDAEVAAAKALHRLASQLDVTPKEIRELISRASKRTHVVPPDRVASIIQRVGDAYDTGALEPLGLSPRIARDTHTYHDADLGRLAQSLYFTENLLDFELDQFQLPDTWAEVRRFTQEVAAGPRVLRAVDRIMDYRRAPDLRALFRDGVLKVKDIPRLRVDRATIEFRRFLWSRPDPADAEAIARDFVGDVAALKSGSIGRYIKNGFTTVGLAFAQDALLEPAHLGFPAHAVIDGGIALSGFIATAVAEKFFRRQPSAFFDRIVDPALEAARLRDAG
jgi:hypothetical protein